MMHALWEEASTQNNLSVYKAHVEESREAICYNKKPM
jgi:hypothetical protein